MKALRHGKEINSVTAQKESAQSTSVAGRTFALVNLQINFIVVLISVAYTGTILLE